MAAPIEYEYRFTEYEYEFDAINTGDQREVSEFRLVPRKACTSESLGDFRYAYPWHIGVKQQCEILKHNRCVEQLR